MLPALLLFGFTGDRKTQHHLIHHLSHVIRRAETAQNGYQHDTPQADNGINQNTVEALAGSSSTDLSYIIMVLALMMSVWLTTCAAGLD